jgi:hypothetical protein
MVRVGDDLYTRSVNGADAAWFRGTRVRHEGHVSAGGVDADVDFLDVGGMRTLSEPGGGDDQPAGARDHAQVRAARRHTRSTAGVTMQKLSKQPSAKGPAEMFTGDAYQGREQ